MNNKKESDKGLYSSDKENQDLYNFIFLDHPRDSNNVIRREDADATQLKDREFLLIKYNRYKILFFILDALFLKLLKIKKADKKSILFQNSKYSSIISETKKHYNVGLIAQGFRDRIFAIKNFMGYLGANDLDQYIFHYLKEKNIKYLHKLIEKIENILKTVNPDYIVLNSDSPPLERAIIWASRKLGITVIEIQHGIYNPSVVPLTNGRAADYILLWGEYFKKLYVEKNIRNPGELYVLGYPFSVEKKDNIKNRGNHYVVCYLGEDFERYNKDLLEVKLKTVKSISEICKKLGLKFVYRPHPWEDRRLTAEKLPDVQFTPETEKISETFDKSDIFIGFSSTALAEAMMNSKLSLQLMIYPIKLDNFEKLGACSKSFENIAELENYLAKLASAPDLDEFKPKFDNNYIETKYSPGRRFLEILEEIEKQKK